MPKKSRDIEGVQHRLEAGRPPTSPESHAGTSARARLMMNRKPKSLMKRSDLSTKGAVGAGDSRRQRPAPRGRGRPDPRQRDLKDRPQGRRGLQQSSLHHDLWRRRRQKPRRCRSLPAVSSRSKSALPPQPRNSPAGSRKLPQLPKSYGVRWSRSPLARRKLPAPHSKLSPSPTQLPPPCCKPGSERNRRKGEAID